MHRKFLVVLIAGLLLLAACTQPAAPVQEQPTQVPPTEVPEPTKPPPTEAPAVEEELTPDEEMARELWEELQAAGYQENWATVPGKGKLYKGQAPHGALLSTYLSPEAVEALKSKPGEMPADAIIVKENYTPDEQLDSITVMYKEPGYDPDHGDWYWAKFAPDGTMQAAGKPKGCISCHGSVRSNDYIFTFPIAPIEAAKVAPTDEMLAMAQELWDEIQGAGYRENWATVPGKGELYEGQGPHGMLLSTYLSPEAVEALQSKPGEVPADAIIVKENWTAEKELDSITVMYKEPGFDPNHRDWYWAKFAPDGTVQAAGQPKGCISCHGSVRSNDYIFTFPLAPISPEGAPPEVETPSAEAPMTEKEMAELPPAPSVEEVAPLVAKGGCGGCHTAPAPDGMVGIVGPSWCDTVARLQSGEKGVDYIRTSIVDPNAEIVEGFAANVMPQNFGDTFTEEEIELLVAFIANLKCG